MRLGDLDELVKVRPFRVVGGPIGDYTEGFVDCAEEAREAIKNAPTIDPVKAAGGCYCRECRWYDAGKNDSESWSDCTIRYGKHFNVSPMDFCSYGQRKESAHE